MSALAWQCLSAIVSVTSVASATTPARAQDGDRFAYLHRVDPYYPSLSFPRLTTPQWIGEEGVDAAVILAVDDLGDPARYETFLRPIIDRLKEIDGRAPISLMATRASGDDPRVARWLEEGLRIECHTSSHPCPLLAGGDLARAKADFDGNVDLLWKLPGDPPVAFRMPCMDSMNSPSPRFFSEIFCRSTPAGRFLRVDSSVSILLTPDDPDLPRDLVVAEDGGERFRRYLPSPSYVNTIENYPYPYVVAGRVWELPCAVPSDWAAQHLRGTCRAETVRDWKAGIDATMVRQGVFTMVFHPHGWIRSEQIVELIDHVVSRHGSRVRFLTFAEARERLLRGALGGHPLRAADGGDGGVRLVDLDADGHLDVIVGRGDERTTRLWSPERRAWRETDLPASVVEATGAARGRDAGLRLGEVGSPPRPVAIVRTASREGAWVFRGGAWRTAPEMLAGLRLGSRPVLTARSGVDHGVRFCDLDGDGSSELVCGHPEQSGVWRWSAEQGRWERLPFRLPGDVTVVDEAGRDAGLRLVDVNSDLRPDVLFSNEARYGLWLLTSLEAGWSQRVLGAARASASGEAGENEGSGEADESGGGGAGEQAPDLPPIAIDGTDAGAWFHSDHLWVQNEHTAEMPDRVDRCAFRELLRGVEPGPVSPEAGLASLRLRPGFRAELVAAEPLVRDPVAMQWGADGELWVAEMIDYPLGMDGKGKPGGKIVTLHDDDGDGRYDRRQVFLEDVPFPTGVRPWRRGVLVTAVPRIFYAEDTDGDGRADVEKPLYTGFAHGNEQHLINSLEWGLDGWLWCANGDSGGVVLSHRTGKRVDIGGRDLRIHPDTGGIDLTTGRTQYGRCRDDWGSWFGCSNPSPMFHFALDDGYLRRNPHVRPPSPRVFVAPVASRVWPASPPQVRFNDLHMEDHFTSCCGLLVYRDDLFGPHFAGNGFISEPAHNLVSRMVVRPTGSTFTSSRAPGEERGEFLASTDIWFRPAQLRAGPDGALWVTDMYRLVNEHPEYFFIGNFGHLDVRAGDDLGRIYRIYPVDRPPRAIPKLGRLATRELALALDSPSGWQRDMAHQLLVHRADPAATEPLREIARTSARPQARLHALCALDQLSSLDTDLIRRTLTDPHPGVRRRAVRLAESRLRAGDAALGEAVALRVTGPDPETDLLVRMQLAYTLGEWKAPAAGRALARLALEHSDDEILTAAVLSSAMPSLPDLLAGVLGTEPADAALAGRRDRLVERLLPLAAVDDAATLDTALTLVTRVRDDGAVPTWQLGALTGLLDTLRSVRHALTRDPDRPLAARCRPLLTAAREAATSSDAPLARRLAATRLLGRSPVARGGTDLPDVAEDVAALGEVLAPRCPPDLRAEAIDSLGRTLHEEVPTLLVESWSGFSPALRSRALDILLRRERWLTAVLDAVEVEDIPAMEIDATKRRRFLEHSRPEIRERAEKLLLGGQREELAAVLQRFEKVSELQGDPTRAVDLHEKICGPCHLIAGRGQNIGPDMASLTDKSTRNLLISIIDPNRSLDPKYALYSAVTRDGEVLSGLLEDETGSTVTLVDQEGKRHVLLRRDLEQFESGGASMMPEGLEKDLTLQDMADLIALLQSTTPPRRVFPGNEPRLVTADAHGALELSAATCEIYGDTLRFEPRYKNLGYWQSRSDMATWQIEVPRAGEYEIHIRWACPLDGSGDWYVIASPTARFEARVPPTGSWDRYERTGVGRIVLEKGTQRISMYARDEIDQYLIDLQAIILRPAVSP